MALITLLSDFGLQDHYVAALKAKILSSNPQQAIVDISHQISLSNLAQAAQVLGSVYRDFPAGTVHLVAVENSQASATQAIAAEVEKHLFVTPDSGLLGLLSDQPLALCVSLGSYKGSFLARDLLAPAAAQLASGAGLASLGEPVVEPKGLIFPKARASKSQILGVVRHIDANGNLITNIVQRDFEHLHQQRPFSLQVGRENLSRIQEGYAQGEGGDCLATFNSGGYLEIFIKNGRADQLLGLRIDSPINLLFET